MRLDTSAAPAVATVRPGTVRPVRLRVGALRFSMEADEAIDLARQLVAAVDELKAAQR